MREQKVKKLQLVDGEKFNALLNILHKEKSEDKILQDATNTPKRVGMIEAHDKMKQSVAKNSPLAGLNKIQYLKKRQNYKDQFRRKRRS